MNRFTRLQLLLLNTLAVAIAIIVAYVLQHVIVNFTEVGSAVANLAFAFTLPVGLLSLQVVIRNLHHDTNSILPGFGLKPKLNQQTIVAVELFHKQLLSQLKQLWGIEQCDLYVFDWQRNAYLDLCPQTGSAKNDQPHFLPVQHALVRYAKEYHAIYFTERHLPNEDYVSDTVLAEIVIFMRRHKYVLALPLTTPTDVYGFAMFTLPQIKDTKLFAQSKFDDLKKVGDDFGGLLHKILIYDSIVLKQNE